MGYTENLPKYQSCREVQARDSLRSDECMAGVHCKGNKLLDDYGKCKFLRECTCYDASTETVHDPGAVITKSCATWLVFCNVVTLWCMLVNAMTLVISVVKVINE